MKDRINAVKGRERFRPVAPSVVQRAADDWFDLVPSPLWATMSGAARVRPVAAKLIPAAVHVDGKSRVQVVDPQTHPRFHALIEDFGRCSGVPVVLNTSFNAAGEPIVETPEEAFDSARAMGLDALYVSDLRIELTRDPA